MASLALAFDILARDRASATFDKVGDAAERTGRRGERFGAAVAGGVLVAGAAALKFGKDSVAAFSESEQSSLRLDAALAKFPKTADVSRASFDKLNTALAEKTRFDDDATASGQAVLAQFKLTGTQIQQLTPLLQDYAAKTGKDLPTAALDFGKAVLGQGKALKEVGLNLKDTGSATGNLDQLTAGLRQQVGGFAEKEGKTAAGQAQILGNRFGEVQEKVGSKLTPALTTLAGKLVDVINFTDRNSKVVVPLTAAVGALALGVVALNVATAVSASVTAAATTARAFFTTTTIAATGVERASTISRIAGTVATVASTVAMKIATIATKAYAVAQVILNAALTANPIGLVIVALAAIGVALVVAYQKSETFRNVVDGALRSVQSGFSSLRDVASKALKVIVYEFSDFAYRLLQGATLAFGWIPGLGSKLKGAADSVRGFRDAANAALDGIRDKTIDVRFQLNGTDRLRDEAARLRPRQGDGPGAGGPMLARISKLIAGTGLSVSSTYRTPARNAAIGGSPSSYHLDRNNPAVDVVGPPGQLDRLFSSLRGGGGLRELLWRVPGHFDHLHAADQGGIFKGPGLVKMGPGYETFASGLRPAQKVADLPPGNGSGVTMNYYGDVHTVDVDEFTRKQTARMRDLIAVGGLA